MEGIVRPSRPGALRYLFQDNNVFVTFPVSLVIISPMCFLRYSRVTLLSIYFELEEGQLKILFQVCVNTAHQQQEWRF